MSGYGENGPGSPAGRNEIGMTERWSLVAAVLLFGVLSWLLAPILTPFLIAALLAYMGDPLVDRLEARRIPRTAGVVIVFSVISLVSLTALLVLLPLLQQQIVKLIASMPRYLDQLHVQVVPWLSSQFGIDPAMFDVARIKQLFMERWREAGDLATQVLGSVFHSGLAFMGWLANIVLIPVVTFYLLRDWDIFVARVHEMIPRRWEPDVARLAMQSDEVLSAFLRGQLLVMLALAVLYATGLWMVGLEFALLIGLLAGLVSFVPYLGFIVGALLAGVAAWLQFQEWSALIGVLAVFGVGQLAESLVLTPKLVGDRIGLHPVAVMFAVMAGGQLFGFFGILLALPVAAVAMVLLRHVHERYMRSGIYAR